MFAGVLFPSNWHKLQGMDSAPLRLHQPLATKVISGLFFLASLVTVASSLNIPWVTMRVVLSLYSACFVFFSYRRFQLTFCSVEMGPTSLKLDYPWKSGKSKITYEAIRQAHFSRFPFDLVVSTDQGDVRIPRTLDGFQKICDHVFRSILGGQENSWPVTVKVQKPLILSGVLCTLITSAIAFRTVQGGLTWLGIPLMVLSVACTAVFMDELILRRYYFHPEGLRVKGLFTNNWYTKDMLLSANVTKRTFWSSIEFDFNGKQVTIEDRRVDTPIPLIASLVEQGWKCKVQGAKQSASEHAKVLLANADSAVKS